MGFIDVSEAREDIEQTNDSGRDGVHEAQETEREHVETAECGAGYIEESPFWEGKEECTEHPPNSIVHTPEGRMRTDDRGEPHMAYDEKDGAWKLIPDNTYEVNGYVYETDSKGRIEHVEGDVHIREGKRKPINAQVEDMGENDQRGHVIADQMDGSNRIDNLVAMPEKLNNGDYRMLEQKLADARREGHDVRVDTDISYGDDSKRPNGLIVAYSIDGEEDAVMFEYEDYDRRD